MKIIRRDFLNQSLLAAGAALLDLPAPAQRRPPRDTFTGYGGTGDYAASNGDPWPVVPNVQPRPTKGILVAITVMN